MVQQNSLLVMLVQLVDHIPIPTPMLPTAKRGKGRPVVYSERLFLKALVIMIVKHLHTPYELLSVLAQPTPEMEALRSLLIEGGRYPTRCTWERRLAALPDKLPAQMGCLGCHLVELIQPWASYGRAVAADSTVLRSLAIENFNEHFKSIFDGHAQVHMRGLVNVRRFALGAVFVYQLALLYSFEHLGLRGSDLNAGLKPCLKAA